MRPIAMTTETPSRVLYNSEQCMFLSVKVQRGGSVNS